MKSNVEFYDESVVGTDCVLHVSMSGTKEMILKKLEGMVEEMKSSYGKPYQGCVSQFNLISHVITPIWKGEDY